MDAELATAVPHLRRGARGALSAAIVLPTMNPSTIEQSARRRNMRLAVIIAAVALALYVGWWLKAVL